MNDLMTVEQGKEILANLKIRQITIEPEKIKIHKNAETGAWNMEIGDNLHEIRDKSGLKKVTGISDSLFAPFTDDFELGDSMRKHLMKKVKGPLGIVFAKDRIINIEPFKQFKIDPLAAFETIVDNCDIQSIAGIHHDKGLVVDFLSNVNGNPDKREGDISSAGIEMRWGTDVEVAPYIYRLVCATGMKTLSYGVPRQISDFTEVKEVLKNLVMEIVNKRSPELLNKFFDLDNHVEENPEQSMIRMGRDGGIRKGLITDMVEHIPSLPDGDITSYDLMNIITSFANTEEMPKLQEVAGLLTEKYHDSSRCSRCSCILN